KYDINDDLNIYFNVAQGFRSGGFNGAGQPPYDPEEVLSYELGSKMSSSDGRIKADVALFHSTYGDYQIAGFIPSLGLNIMSNAGEAEILGVEMSVNLHVNDQLELGFNGNYMDTEFVEINATSTSHILGDPLDQVPQYGYSLWANSGFNWSEHSPGFIRVDYGVQGKSNFRNRNFGTSYRSQSSEIRMLNMRLGWSYDDWSVDLYALNLLDEDGFIGPLVIEESSSRPRPRTLGLKVGVKF
ncbi:TonB-dependent receptor, partial [bacterium]|nr:TonB-dependent receptor [bacterium]